MASIVWACESQPEIVQIPRRIRRAPAITGPVRVRAQPIPGRRVEVVFLGHRAGGTVHAVDPDGRGLEVATDDGELLRFELRRATASFEGAEGARLYFAEPAPALAPAF